MSTEHGLRAKEIFAELTAAAPADRPVILEQRCGGDAALRAELVSLLAFHDPTDEFLSRSALHDAGLSHPGSAEEANLPAGTRLGKYTVVRTLGAGGMGMVYEARQDHPDRAVALKVMRPGFVSASMARRFRQEASMLALLQHPGIAQVFDAGKEPAGASGTPYLAMELVHGIAITQFASARALDQHARLALFLRVCEAVAHAHQRGVIHRDLKPANILVGEDGAPKVLDFGIARLAEPDPHATMVTGAATLGGQLLGTLAYMSPEQASGDPRALDVRADVYALGVILFELLAGRLPIPVSECSLPEAVRRVLEQEPPRLGTLARALRGDLETITARALEKSLARRYASVSDLAEDVRRHLAGEPIRAKSDSALYVLGKTIRRHRWPVAAAGLLVAALAAFSLYASIQTRREREARQDTERALTRATEQERLANAARSLAEQQRSRADAVSHRLATQLRSSNIERGKALAGRGSWPAAIGLLWTEHLHQPDDLHSLWALRDLYARCPISLAFCNPGPKGFRTVAYSPSGDVLVTCAGEAGLLLVDPDTGDTIGTAPTLTPQLTDLDFSPDGSRLAAAGENGSFLVWDVSDRASPRLVWRRPPTVSSETSTIRYASGGDRLLACSNAGPCLMLDPRDGRVLHTFERPGVTLRNASWHPDGRLAVACGDDDRLYLLHTGAGAGEPDITLLGTVPRLIGVARFTPDGTRVLAGTRDSLLTAWDWQQRQRLTTVNLGNGSVRNLDFSPDGELVSVAGYWETLFLRTQTLERVHPGGVTVDMSGLQTAWRPDMSAIAVAGSYTRGTMVWEFYPESCTRRFRAHRAAIGRISLSADGSRLLTIASDAALIWDTTTWQRLARVTLSPVAGGTSGPVNAYVGGLSPDGRLVALADRTGRVEVRELATGTLVDAFEGPTDNAPADLTFLHDGRTLVLANNRGRVVVRDASEHRTEHSLRPSGRELFGFDVEASGPTFVLAQRSGSFSIVDASNGQMVGERDTGFSPWRPGMTPDGTRVAFGNWAGDVWVYDARSLRELWHANGHSQLAELVRFSTDGSLLASASGDGIVQLWNAANGDSLATLTALDAASGLSPRRAAVTNVLFVPGSTRMLVTYLDGVIEDWDLTRIDRRIARSLPGATARLTSDPAIRLREAQEWAARVLAAPESR